MGIISSLVGAAIGAVTYTGKEIAGGTADALEMGGAPPVLSGMVRSLEGIAEVAHAGGQSLAGSLGELSPSGFMASIESTVDRANGFFDSMRGDESLRGHGLDAILASCGVEKQQFGGQEFSAIDEPCGNIIRTADDFFKGQSAGINV